MLIDGENDLLESYTGAASFTPTIQPKDGILRATGDGYLIMVDSAWEKMPKNAENS